MKNEITGSGLAIPFLLLQNHESTPTLYKWVFDLKNNQKKLPKASTQPF